MTKRILIVSGIIFLIFLFVISRTYGNLDTPIGQVKGYQISVQFSGIKDTVCYLANYYGDKTYLTDTALVDSKGRFIFEGDTALPGGVYIIAGQSNNKYLELIIDKVQVFSISANISTISSDVRFQKSEDNVIFFDYIQFNLKTRKEIEELRKEQQKVMANADSVKLIKKKISQLDSDINLYQKRIIAENPESFVSVMLKAMQEPEAGKMPLLANGREDSVYRYQYFKSHYWDNFDLTDDRLLRTPLFHKRIERYFKEVIVQNPDSLIVAADKYIDKTRSNKEVFKYSVWYLTYKFETSKIMGFDEIFVHMVDTYYTRGEAFWTDSSTIKALTKRAEEIKPILIGKNAPELILIDTSGSFISLYHINAKYLIVLFYESDCGHCKKEINILKDMQPDSIPGCEIFAVCTDTSLVKWKKFIHDQKSNWIHVNGTRSITKDYHKLYNISVTPTLFLLDENKKIIAKRLNAEQMIHFLKNYDRNIIKQD